MCVLASGWNDEVIATPLLNGSAGTSLVSAPSRASEFVLVSEPSRAEIRGSTPVSRMACSSRWVPSAPAERITWRAVNVPVRVSIRQPSPSGRIAVTSVSGWTVAPLLSAR